MMRNPFPLILASVSLAAAAVAQAPEPKILSSSDVSTLQKRAQKWVEAALAYEIAESPAQRRKEGRNESKARQELYEEMRKRAEKTDFMASVDDLRAIFYGTFPYGRETASGELKKVTSDDARVQPHYVVVQRGYTGKEPMRLVMSIPGYDSGRSAWRSIREHYDATWGSSSLGEQTILAMPELGAEDDLDTPIDPSAANFDEVEFKRMKTVLGTQRGVSFTYNVDFDRVFLDVSRGSSAFGMRFATYFPQAFAGLIVRDPVDVAEELRFGSLRGLPILFVAGADTKDAADKMAAKLNELQAGQATVIEPDQAKIDEWVKAQRRQITPKTVVVEPNHDKFNDAYWVQTGRVAALASLPANDRPRMEVTADREQNRIEVTARHIQDFRLRLNDDLIDLSKPFTVVVNGTAKQEQRTRSRELLLELILQRRDPNYVFTVEFGSTVPEAEAATGGGN